MKDFSIDAIIPAYNCEKTIGAVLDCLFAAVPEGITIGTIIVDDASTDGTAEICREYPVELIQLTENHGPAYCRNLAVQNSRSECLFFLDSDIEFEPDLLTKMVAVLKENPDLAGVYTLTSPDPLNRTFTSRYFALQEYFRFMDIYEHGCTSWSFISTRCGLLKREIFDRTGGFNENFSIAAYEDLEFSCRMNDRYQLALRPDFVVQHFWPDSIWKMLKRLHVNARGVMNFPQNMRNKASIPFIKDRNARVLTAISWIMAVCGFIWWPACILAVITHLTAMYQAFWLLRGCFRYEGIFFTVKAWGTYNMTIFPFMTGVWMGFGDKIQRFIVKNGKKI